MIKACKGKGFKGKRNCKLCIFRRRIASSLSPAAAGLSLINRRIVSLRSAASAAFANPAPDDAGLNTNLSLEIFDRQGEKGLPAGRQGNDYNDTLKVIFSKYICFIIHHN